MSTPQPRIRQPRSRQPRTPSPFVVHEVDFTAVKEAALTGWKTRNADAEPDKVPTHFSTYARLGFVELPNGSIYVLDSEGVGALYTHDDEEQISVGLYPNWNGGFSVVPTLEARYDVAAFKLLPLKAQVPLVDFIRKFGARLESNYTETASFLAEQTEGAEK